ncbi:hypothetical protein LXL04_034630 [Taraxacum kok-saghyz]
MDLVPWGLVYPTVVFCSKASKSKPSKPATVSKHKAKMHMLVNVWRGHACRGRLAIVLGFPSGGPRFESWGDASGFTPVVRGFLRIGGLLFGVTKVVVTAGGAIAVLTDPPSTNLTPPVPKKTQMKLFYFEDEVSAFTSFPN